MSISRFYIVLSLFFTFFTSISSCKKNPSLAEKRREAVENFRARNLNQDSSALSESCKLATQEFLGKEEPIALGLSDLKLDEAVSVQSDSYGEKTPYAQISIDSSQIGTADLNEIGMRMSIAPLFFMIQACTSNGEICYNNGNFLRFFSMQNKDFPGLPKGLLFLTVRSCVGDRSFLSESIRSQIKNECSQSSPCYCGEPVTIKYLNSLDPSLADPDYAYFSVEYKKAQNTLFKTANEYVKKARVFQKSCSASSSSPQYQYAKNIASYSASEMAIYSLAYGETLLQSFEALVEQSVAGLQLGGNSQDPCSDDLSINSQNELKQNFDSFFAGAEPAKEISYPSSDQASSSDEEEAVENAEPEEESFIKRNSLFLALGVGSLVAGAFLADEYGIFGNVSEKVANILRSKGYLRSMAVSSENYDSVIRRSLQDLRDLEVDTELSPEKKQEKVDKAKKKLNEAISQKIKHQKRALQALADANRSDLDVEIKKHNELKQKTPESSETKLSEAKVQTLESRQARLEAQARGASLKELQPLADQEYKAMQSEQRVIDGVLQNDFGGKSTVLVLESAVAAIKAAAEALEEVTKQFDEASAELKLKEIELRKIELEIEKLEAEKSQLEEEDFQKKIREFNEFKSTLISTILEQRQKVEGLRRKKIQAEANYNNAYEKFRNFLVDADKVKPGSSSYLTRQRDLRNMPDPKLEIESGSPAKLQSTLDLEERLNPTDGSSPKIAEIASDPKLKADFDIDASKTSSGKGYRGLVMAAVFGIAAGIGAGVGAQELGLSEGNVCENFMETAKEMETRLYYESRDLRILEGLLVEAKSATLLQE